MYTYRPDRPLREQTLTTARRRLTEEGFEEATGSDPDPPNS